MNKSGGFVVGTGLLLAGLVSSLLVFLAAGSDQPGAGNDCAPTDTGEITQVSGAAMPDLTPAQERNAATIIAVGRKLDVSTNGVMVALMVAFQEATMLNKASAAYPESKNYPHDEVADGDHDSVGIFQQRAAWGPMADRMNVVKSAAMFFLGGQAGQKGLLDYDYESMEPTVAAQTVQVSAYPDAYAKWEDEARAILSANAPGIGGAGPEGVGPEAQRAANFIRQTFKFDGDIGGRRDDPGSQHHHGLAIDVMLDAYQADERALGQQIADYFAGPGAKPFGVANVIWRQEIANEGKGWKFIGMEDRGSKTENHFDHVHIDFTDGGGTSTTTPPAPGSAVIPALDSSGVEECAPTTGDAATTATGPVVLPVKGTNRNNYGNSGGHWARGHTGTDFSVGCGTPVVAAHAGTIEIDTTQGWSGPWLVKVAAGPKTLTTWYAHMQKVTVEEGATVRPGQQIGEVGREGNSTGCHLHFEVHPKNGSIYEDGVNPSEWLVENVGKKPKTATTVQASDTMQVPPVTNSGGGRVLASWNLLGQSHTEPGGHSAHRPSGVDRMPATIRFLTDRQVSVAGLQEFQPKQIAAFNRLVGESFAMHADKDNAVVWRRDMYDLADKGTVDIPYFGGNKRDMPWVLLDPKGPGKPFYVLSLHNPANVRGPAAKWRAEAVRNELAWGQAAARTGLPVYIVGDFNDREPAFCGMTSTSVFTAAAGGGTGAPCKPPSGRLIIDWIFGANTQFGGFTIDKSAKAVSDHNLLIARIP